MSKKKRRKKDHCLNCGKGLQNWMNFCPKCGQENHVKRATIKLLLSDFLKDYWTFDSKFFRSIIPLLFKPGFLTKEFIEGKRKKYIPPVRLYLFISFVFFLVSSLVPEQNNDGNNSSELISLEYDENTEETDSLTIDMMYDMTKENPILQAQYGDISKDSLQSLFEKNPNMKETLELMRKTQNDKFGAFFDKHFTKLFFFLIPILALLFLSFFYKKNFFYVDYLVFTLHLQSFYFALLLVIMCIQFFYPLNILSLISIFVLFIYGMIAAKKVFKTSYIGSVFRLLGVSISYMIALGLSFVVMIIISLLFI